MWGLGTGPESTGLLFSPCIVIKQNTTGNKVKKKKGRTSIMRLVHSSVDTRNPIEDYTLFKILMIFNQYIINRLHKYYESTIVHQLHQSNRPARLCVPSANNIRDNKLIWVFTFQNYVQRLI